MVSRSITTSDPAAWPGHGETEFDPGLDDCRRVAVHPFEEGRCIGLREQQEHETRANATAVGTWSSKAINRSKVVGHV